MWMILTITFGFGMLLFLLYSIALTKAVIDIQKRNEKMDRYIQRLRKKNTQYLCEIYELKAKDKT